MAAAIPVDELTENQGRLAYDMYVRFRPEIPGGVAGWGAQGKLRLDLLHEIEREFVARKQAPVHGATARALPAKTGSKKSSSEQMATVPAAAVLKVCSTSSDDADSGRRASTPSATATATADRARVDTVYSEISKFTDGVAIKTLVSTCPYTATEIQEAIEILSEQMLVYEPSEGLICAL